jgi:endonuclease YncB( thermonuclease family)
MSLQQLQNVTDKDIQRSKNSPPTNISTSAKVVSVYDGDTCDLVIIRNGSLQRFKCRLAEINTPEMDTGRKAEKARDFLAWLSIGDDPASFPGDSQPWSEVQLQNQLDANKKLVHAEFQGVGYYGRPLVILKKASGDKYSFNDLLMQYGYAEPYGK